MLLFCATNPQSALCTLQSADSLLLPLLLSDLTRQTAETQRQKTLPLQHQLLTGNIAAAELYNLYLQIQSTTTTTIVATHTHESPHAGNLNMSGIEQMRPRDSTLLHDQHHHLTDQIWNGKDPGSLRCIHNEFPRDKWELSEKQIELVQMTGLHHLAELKKPTTDWELLNALVERWRPETNTFHFTFGEATITLEDVSFIYGLPIDGEPIIGRTFAEEEAYMGLFEELLGVAPELKYCHGSQVNNTWLQSTFGKLEDPTPEKEIYQVRAFLLDLVSSQIFTNSSGARAYAFILQFFRNFERHSWGTACLANLYRQLGQASKKSRTLAGNNSLLQYWAQSRLRLGSCELDIERDPFMYPLGHVFYPQSPNTVKNNHKVYRALLDSLDEYSFNWTVYMPKMKQLRDNTEERDRSLFTTCTYLIFMWMIEWHNPDRVMKQFGLCQVVPPVFRQPPQRKLTMSRKSVDYSTSLKEYLPHWEDRGKKTIMGDEDSITCHTKEYFTWYYPLTVKFVDRSSLSTASKYPPKKPPIRSIRPRPNKESTTMLDSVNKRERSNEPQASTDERVLVMARTRGGRSEPSSRSKLNAGTSTSMGASDFGMRSPTTVPEWTKLKNREARHLSDYISANEAVPIPSSRVSWLSVHQWWKKLSEPLKARIIDMGFGQFFSIEPFPVDEVLMATLSERWRDEYHTFHFPIGELTVTLEDVAQCWGLRVNGDPVFTEGVDADPRKIQERFTQYFGLQMEDQSGIDLAWLAVTYGGMCSNRPVTLREEVEREEERRGSDKGGEDGGAGGGEALDDEARGERSLALIINDSATSSASHTAPPTVATSRVGSSGKSASQKKSRTSRKRPREESVSLVEGGEGEQTESSSGPPREPRRHQPAPKGKKRETDDAKIRAFLMYFFGQCLFANATEGKGSTVLLALVEDLDEVKNKAWGAAALAYLFYGLDDRVRAGSGISSLQGFAPILQIWFWEHFTCCRPTRLPERLGLFPLARTWSPNNGFWHVVGQPIEIPHSGVPAEENSYRQIFDSLDEDEIIFCPYEGTDHGGEPVVAQGLSLFGRDIWVHAPQTCCLLMITYAARQIGLHTDPGIRRNFIMALRYLGYAEAKYKGGHPAQFMIDNWKNGGVPARTFPKLCLAYNAHWMTYGVRHILPARYTAGGPYTLKSHRARIRILENELRDLRALQQGEGVPPALHAEALEARDSQIRILVDQVATLEATKANEVKEAEVRLTQAQAAITRLQDEKEKLANDLAACRPGQTSGVGEMEERIKKLEAERVDLKEKLAFVVESGLATQKLLDEAKDAQARIEADLEALRAAPVAASVPSASSFAPDIVEQLKKENDNLRQDLLGLKMKRAEDVVTHCERLEKLRQDHADELREMRKEMQREREEARRQWEALEVQAAYERGQKLYSHDRLRSHDPNVESTRGPVALRQRVPADSSASTAIPPPPPNQPWLE